MTPLHRPLLSWYGRNRRRLPWRETASPYRTWISEIMLQQTQVSTVVPYFERFVARFPGPAELAAAPERDVLEHWAGLGYYSRARNLHKAAKEIVSLHGGSLPRTEGELISLRGIGRYTAAAVASIAFGQPAPLVDGNVARVFARLFALREPAKSPELFSKAWALAARHMHRGRPGDWNQALMELGALVCLPAPETPRCGVCPLRKSCAARAQGLERSTPRASPGRAPLALSWTVLRIERGGRILLWRRGPEERLLPGHWGLPESRHLRRAKPGELIKTVRHSITHHRISLSVKLAGFSGRIPPQASWVPKREAPRRLVSSLWRKALA